MESIPHDEYKKHNNKGIKKGTIVSCQLWKLNNQQNQLKGYGTYRNNF